MKKILTFAVVLVFVFGACQFVSAQNTTNQIVGASLAKINQAIASHPEPLVRETLARWRKEGLVRFVPTPNVQGMILSLGQEAGKEVVLVTYNVRYILTAPDVALESDKEAWLWLGLFHEAVHIDDHFSGRIPMKPVGPVAFDYYARTVVWNTEWSATTKEWAFAKRIGKTHLVPVIYEATRNGENARTFLDGFYRMRIEVSLNLKNPMLAAAFEARYKEELAKLPRR